MISAITKGIEGLTKLFGDMNRDQVRDLFLNGGDSPFVVRRRSLLILSRVRMVAVVFALCTPLWIPIDLVIFPTELGIALSVLRGLACISFLALVFAFRMSDTLRSARIALGCLLAIPTVFFIASHPVLGQYEINGPAQQMVAAGYDFLPFVMIAGLSVFPITFLEGFILGAPLVLAKLVLTILAFNTLPMNAELGTLWLLSLIGVVATLAGMSQFHFMSQLVAQASHDTLTKAYTRRVGEEFLEQQFLQAVRNDQPLTVGFVDLDNFKSINDAFGHEEGDKALRNAAEALRGILRRGDILVRWGGEEFLVIMPNTDCAGALTGFGRLHAQGLGLRPDGIRQTASIGIAEHKTDAQTRWADLVEQADQRMYQAKQTGKDKIVACSGKIVANATTPPDGTASQETPEPALA